VVTARERLDVAAIHNFLCQESGWARDIPRSVVEESLPSSLCFGLFHNDEQAGFARVISDYATIAYLGDVFVLREYRGRGLARWLMECVVSHPSLRNLRRWILVTADAHGLYRKFGFSELASPGKFMERHNPDVYRRRPSGGTK
jgi:GNAT superfamily N-acetyltransferase